MDLLRNSVAGIFGRLRHVLPSHRYQLLRQRDEHIEPSSPSATRHYRRLPKWTFKDLVVALLALGALLALIINTTRPSPPPKKTPPVEPPPKFVWQTFRPEQGYFEGLRKLVSTQLGREPGGSSSPSEYGTAYPEPVKYHPYRTNLESQTLPAEPCFLNEESKLLPPSLWAYNGVPESAPEPLLGSHDALGLNKDVCFDRYGRYAAYGFGQDADEGGTGFGIHGDMNGTELTLNKESSIDWRKIDLSRAQRICAEKNRHRFSRPASTYTDDAFHHAENWPNATSLPATDDTPSSQTHPHVPRTAIVLRLWDQYQWTNYSHLYIRSLISELNLNSGAEYDIHMLIQVKDNSPIWASDQVYNSVLERVVTPEYRSLATLWNEDLMRLLYPGPFEPQFNRPGPIHSVGRSMHMALQWFATHHPEYDFFWNWEMDLRYVGHWYELFDRVDKWAEKQPRRGLWERTARFYIPRAHGDWGSFVQDTETRALNGSDALVSGPQTFPNWEEDNRTAVFGSDYHTKFSFPNPPSDTDSTWGTGEPADYITLLPQFDPAGTFWIFRADVSGYSTDLPIPPRRASIVTASRFSARLLRIMHTETFRARHSMCGEMFPASMALHHGLKSVFAPHPMYFSRVWNDSAYVDGVFNSNPTTGSSGGNSESVFSEIPQHNFRGGTYYYDSGFSGRLWRRWLGYKEMGAGGEREERDEKGSGRMCLRSVLLHPVKWEEGDVGS
ncbi:hypothetical protein H2200_003834 [Cladophialophora chaetospira]|uniref:Major facilitator superfamily transporter n=1 Tax=Cladophialophora chaetospira TaxID=386627 RepID=A0AA38XF52_9EURO|nr:hypothetical protein H2200_003834 [Cladophialophora chaetospira]